MISLSVFIRVDPCPNIDLILLQSQTSAFIAEGEKNYFFIRVHPPQAVCKILALLKQKNYLSIRVNP